LEKSVLGRYDKGPGCKYLSEGNETEKDSPKEDAQTDMTKKSRKRLKPESRDLILTKGRRLEIRDLKEAVNGVNNNRQTAAVKKMFAGVESEEGGRGSEK